MTQRPWDDERKGVWGLPPSPLLPRALAEPLAALPLPEGLRGVLPGVEGPTVGDLIGVRWDAIPEGDHEKIAGAIVHFVSLQVPRIRGKKILYGWPAELNPSVMPWSKRVSNILRRTQLIDDPVRLASLEVDELLFIRNLGVRSLIEIAAALDQFTPDLISQSAGVVAVESLASTPAWGENGSPLLPEQVRQRRKDQRLPEWLIGELSLPSDATYLALDSDVWSTALHISPRVETFALRVLQDDLPHLGEHIVLPDVWPDGISPRSVPWKPRVFNCLQSAGLLDDPQRLSQITFGELARLRSMGLKSILDFTVTSETVLAETVDPSSDDIRDVLLEYGDAYWLERVSRADWRFKDLIPVELSDTFSQILQQMEDVQGAYGRRTARTLVGALPEVRKRVQALENQPLDVALREFFKGYAKSQRDLDLVLARLGLHGGSPQTLESIGTDLDITRERVRQIETKARERLPNHPILMPRLPEALQKLAELAPLSLQEAGPALVTHGITTQPLDPLGLLKVAEVFKYEINVSVETVKGVRVVDTLRSADLTNLLHVARAAAGRYGAYNIDDLTTKIAFECSSSEARDLLLKFSSAQFLTDEWFWMPDIPEGRERLRNVTRKILSVSDPIEVTSLRGGLRRVYKWRGIEIVPPTEILRAYYVAHPEFAIDSNGMVSSVDDLDYRKELAGIERKLVEIFDETPNGVLDRHSLEEAARTKHLNVNSLSVFSTYSAIIDHPALNAWTLRGRAVDPGAIEAVREIASSRGREKRTLSHGWSEDGDLWLAVRVGNLNSPVVGIPVAIQSYLVDRSFQALTDDGSPAGTIVVSPEGASWGYGPFLRRRGGDVGDVLMLKFDLATSQVVLTLEDEAVFEN